MSQPNLEPSVGGYLLGLLPETEVCFPLTIFPLAFGIMFGSLMLVLLFEFFSGANPSGRGGRSMASVNSLLVNATSTSCSIHMQLTPSQQQ